MTVSRRSAAPRERVPAVPARPHGRATSSELYDGYQRDNGDEVTDFISSTSRAPGPTASGSTA